jgi:hypothetical protein
MGIIAGSDNFGLFLNGDFRKGTNDNFTFGTHQSTGGPNNRSYIQVTGGGGSTAFSSNRIEVDTTKTYQMSAYMRTFTRGTSNNSLAGGHVGFSCYDKDDVFIDLRSQGGIGNTTLSRTATAGDTTIYITSNSGWYVGTSASACYVIFFPASHPDFSTPYQYSTLWRSYAATTTSITLTGQGDYAVTLGGSLPNWGYSLPAGTPVSNSQSGGSYNYCLGNPNYPETWTRYITAPFTGESRNSSTPFRWGTKYIRFLILRNYNQRTTSPQNHVWGIADIFFGLVDGNRNYTNRL